MPIWRWYVTLQVPSNELETNIGLELPEVVDIPVIEELCSDERCNKEEEIPGSSTSSKLPCIMNQIREIG